jgi:hypothetical protein
MNIFFVPTASAMKFMLLSIPMSLATASASWLAPIFPDPCHALFGANNKTPTLLVGIHLLSNHNSPQ